MRKLSRFAMLLPAAVVLGFAGAGPAQAHEVLHWEYAGSPQTYGQCLARGEAALEIPNGSVEDFRCDYWSRNATLYYILVPDKHNHV